MGQTQGFIEYLRELPKDRTAGERVLDWKEFHIHMPEPDLRKQGARCMDCGIPFCHTGTLNQAGMASGCPIHNLIPEWNDLVYAASWKGGAGAPAQDNKFSRVHRSRLSRPV